jgi:4-amino-4-deoxy-L-arabinose transferase-like glycosyltransferase
MNALRQRLPELGLLGLSLWLRLVNLGYSDLQGDEIKALARLAPGQGLYDFILEQRRGPVQYLITYLVGLLQGDYSNRFLTRLPFALAGLLAVWIFYRFALAHFGQKSALFAALFFSLNGLFIGLTRVVQYQSFVLLFSILALYFFSLASLQERWKIWGLYASAFSWAAAILSHYDGVFITPFVIYLLLKRRSTGTNTRSRYPLKHILLALAILVVLVGLFYLPFAFSISQDTQSYWLERLSGDEAGGQIPSSIITFILYNPTIILYLYLLLGLVSLVRMRTIAPVLVLGFIPWFLFEIVVFDPGTHIYTYLLPGCILAGIGLEQVHGLLERLIPGRYSAAIGVILIGGIFTFLFMVAHLIFIDHTPEYPWSERRILGWKVGLPDEKYRVWVYGFPYNRKWDEVGEYVAANPAGAYYCTNENKPIAGYHIALPFDCEQAGYYVHIYQPQSFRERLANDKVIYWMKKHSPLKAFELNGKVVAEVYQMPPGNLEEIKSLGY